MKKIKYVQLEPVAVISDIDFQLMSAEERGVYWTIILYLYCNDGKCAFDAEVLKTLCKCEDFEKVWEKIKKKFVSRNGFIQHKRVTAELRKAKKFLQHQRRAGLASADARGLKADRGSTKVQPRAVQPSNVKRNEIEEKESKQLRIRNTSSPLQSSGSSSPAGLLTFNEALREIIKPRNQSDRTAFRNIGNWLLVRMRAGQFNEDIFARVLEYAAEAVKGKSRNPAAVFTSLLKRELGYRI